MSEDSQLREAFRFMVRMVIVAIVVILLLELAGCDDNHVTVIAPPGARVDATTNGPRGGCIDVKIERAEGFIPVLVPMPMPYAITAERP